MQEMQEFRYTGFAQEILFGAGKLAQLGEALERFHWQRVMLCSTQSQRRNGHIAAIERLLEGRLVANFEHVQPHVQDFQVAEGLALAREYEVDAIIGLGGGSPIGMAKVVSFALEGQEREQQANSPIEQPLVPVIAIPTTYAGSELTPVYGVTNHVDGQARKVTVSDVRIAPRLIIYDPLLTLDLPPELTASTGINALAHCIEALYSITRNPPSTAVALSGIRAITSSLLRCYEAGDDLEARAEMLNGAFLAGMALAHVSMALHHGLCHVLGGSAGVPHGVANGIILPHAMRFNLDATASQLAPAAEAMGIATAGRDAESAVEEAIQAIYALIGRMRLPQRLRDVGVQESDLPHLARLALSNRSVQNNPKSVTDAVQVEAIFRAAW
ncbi:MAG TPA: iron-containing alcohol dehydrogenase [Ktedonobacteraceae bacterium]|nr:iron-containing alcohol dehydrogenase [Ktedonobacteraceae bacterium]